MDKLTRPELDDALEKLQAWLTQVVDEYPDSDQMDAFAGEAEMLEPQVASEDIVHYKTRVQCMLRDAGLIPGDEEPCDEG